MDVLILCNTPRSFKEQSSCCLLREIGRRRPGANDSAMKFMEKRTIDERSDVDTLEQLGSSPARK